MNKTLLQPFPHWINTIWWDVQAMKERMKNLAESLGMPPGLSGGPPGA
jgi:hypothetical protein